MITQIGFDPWVYDTDGDCYISMSEANAAVNDWQFGDLSQSEALQVVNLWQTGVRNPTCEPLPPPGWTEADRKTATIKPPMPPAVWIEADKKTATIQPTGPPPECTPGETKCVGYNLHTCSAAGEWQLTKHNATECGYVPPTPPPPEKFPWQWLAIGGAAILGGLLLIPKKAKEKIK